MRIVLRTVASLLLVSLFTTHTARAQTTDDCLYNDAHFHVPDFVADGPPLPDILKMMDTHVCRSVVMGLPALWRMTR